jgi:hypothetical protein
MFTLSGGSVHIMYKLNTYKPWYMFLVLLFIPFVVHFEKLVKASNPLAIDPSLLKKKIHNIDNDIEQFITKE